MLLHEGVETSEGKIWGFFFIASLFKTIAGIHWIKIAYSCESKAENKSTTLKQDHLWVNSTICELADNSKNEIEVAKNDFVSAHFGTGLAVPV